MARLGLYCGVLSALFNMLAMSQAWSVAVGDADSQLRFERALQAHDYVVTGFSQRTFQQQTREALRLMVSKGIRLLSEHGDIELADRLRREWRNGAGINFGDTWVRNLGDHLPLNQWLADFYYNLHQALGDTVMHVTHLDDVNVINFAIPVVFQPWGDQRNGDQWNRAEFGLHFVPLMRVVTYWATYAGCVGAAAEEYVLKFFCSRMARVMSEGVSTVVAPRLSDFIYNQLVGVSTPQSFDLDLEGLHQIYADELATAELK